MWCVEDDKLRFLTLRNNRNGYTRAYNNHSDEYDTVIPDNGWYGYFFVPDNAGFNSNKINSSIQIFLSYIYTGDTKYGI